MLATLNADNHGRVHKITGIYHGDLQSTRTIQLSPPHVHLVGPDGFPVVVFLQVHLWSTARKLREVAARMKAESCVTVKSEYSLTESGPQNGDSSLLIFELARSFDKSKPVRILALLRRISYIPFVVLPSIWGRSSTQQRFSAVSWLLQMLS
jgi:hypothetical protein